MPSPTEPPPPTGGQEFSDAHRRAVMLRAHLDDRGTIWRAIGMLMVDQDTDIDGATTIPVDGARQDGRTVADAAGLICRHPPPPF